MEWWNGEPFPLLPDLPILPILLIPPIISTFPILTVLPILLLPPIWPLLSVLPTVPTSSTPFNPSNRSSFPRFLRFFQFQFQDIPPNENNREPLLRSVKKLNQLNRMKYWWNKFSSKTANSSPQKGNKNQRKFQMELGMVEIETSRWNRRNDLTTLENLRKTESDEILKQGKPFLPRLPILRPTQKK